MANADWYFGLRAGGTLFARAGHQVTFSYARSKKKLNRLAKDAEAAREHTLEAITRLVKWMRSGNPHASVERRGRGGCVAATPSRYLMTASPWSCTSVCSAMSGSGPEPTGGPSAISASNPYRIPIEVRGLFDDVRYWIANNTYPPDEIAVRLHHRLVAIHPFPNGNGRLTRLMADLLIEKLGGQPFSWGGGALTDEGALRSRYIAALKAADDHDIGPLLAFARS